MTLRFLSEADRRKLFSNIGLGSSEVQASGAVSTNILHFFARVVVFTCPDRLTAAAPRLLRALLIGRDPKADDQSYDHSPSGRFWAGSAAEGP